MRRASIAVGAVLVVAVVAIRFHRDRPQPQRWKLLGPFPKVDLDQPLGSRTLHVGGLPNLDPQPR